MDFGTFSLPVEAEAEDDQVVAMHGLGLFVCLLPFLIEDGRVDVDAESLSLSSSSLAGRMSKGMSSAKLEWHRLQLAEESEGFLKHLCCLLPC